MQTPESLSAGLILFFIQPYRAANPPLTLAFVTSYDSCLDNCSVGGPTVLKFSLWLRRKFHQGKRLRFEKWFRFLAWSTQIRIGRLSPYAMMGHCGFVMAHGRELRICRRLVIDRAIQNFTLHQMRRREQSSLMALLGS